MHRSVAGLDMGRQVDGDGRRLVALLAAVFERQAYGVGVRHAAVARTAGPALAPTQARPHMDDVRNAWNNAPACVLGTVWGTASIRTWRFRSAPCLPIRQVVTAPLCARYTPSCRRARARLWVCGQRKSVVHIPTGATTNNQHQFDYFGIAGLRPSPSHPGERQSRQPSHITTIAPPSLRGFRQPFTPRQYLGMAVRSEETSTIQPDVVRHQRGAQFGCAVSRARPLRRGGAVAQACA